MHHVALHFDEVLPCFASHPLEPCPTLEDLLTLTQRYPL